MADINNPPPGGFKEGGWYWDPGIGESRHFSGGSFGAGTTLNEPGAAAHGQRISKDVQAQSGFIAPDRPTSANGVTPYLNKFQNNAYATDGRPDIKIPTLSELKTELAPSVERPELIDRAGKFEELRKEQGLEALEQTLVEIKAEEEKVYATLRQRKALAEGKPVATGVIAGRVGEIEKQERENLDFVQRRKSRVIDELNMKYNVVNTYMNFFGLDYQDAVKRYDTEFSQNVDMYKIVTGRQDAALDQYNKDRANASANLTMIMNAASAGNIDYASMSEDQKVMISKLEAQAGMPLGTMSSIRKDPDADILFTTSDNGVTQVGFRNADGTIRVEKYGTSTKKPTEKQERVEAFSDMARTLNELGGGDKLVSPQEWKSTRSAWIKEGFDARDFDEAFRGEHVDENRSPDEYGLSFL